MGIVKTYWDLDPPGKPGFEVFLEVGSEHQTIAETRAAMPTVPPSKGEHSIMVCSAPLEVPRLDGGLRLRLGLKKSQPGSGEREVAARPVALNGRAAYGPYMVYVAP